MMKLHFIQHISQSPLHRGFPSSWPAHLAGYATAEAMGDVVSAVELEGRDSTMLPGSARLLYFSKRRKDGAGVYGVVILWLVLSRF